VLLELADGVCRICGRDLNPLDFEVDHIEPLSRGGDHSYENCAPVHRGCNARKGDKPPEGVIETIG